MRRLIVALVVATVALGGYTFVRSASTARAWIDAPLSATIVTVAPVEVVAHATDPDGVVEVRLDVNGATVATAIPESVGETLVVVRLSWTPTASGLYRLDVLGRDPAGEWGTPGIARVRVELGTVESTTTTTTTIAAGTSTTSGAPAPTTATTAATPTTRPTPTTAAPPTTPVTTTPTVTTSAPPTTAAPTTTECALGVPTLATASRTDSLTPILAWNYSGCRAPAQFRIELSRDANFLRPDPVGFVGGSERSWVSSQLVDCITYWWRVQTFEGGAPQTQSSTGTFQIVQTRCP